MVTVARGSTSHGSRKSVKKVHPVANSREGVAAFTGQVGLPRFLATADSTAQAAIIADWGGYHLLLFQVF
jgi:hypothetical protein